MQTGRNITGNGLFILFCVIMSKPAKGMTLSGPITASAVTVTGDVTMSSMTVSSTTITNLLNVEGTTSGVKGLVLQTIFSSTTVNSDTTSSTLTPIPGMSATITLLNANDYVRISVTGMLEEQDDGPMAYLSVERDSTDLGDGSFAPAGYYPSITSVGVRITDSPGDTNPHTYQATFCTDGGGMASFTVSPVGYFLLEEIGQ